MGLSLLTRNILSKQNTQGKYNTLLILSNISLYLKSKTLIISKVISKRNSSLSFYYKTYKNKRIFNNPNIVKILFFETAYDNMYHFIFQYYPSLIALLEFCRQNSLDYYVVMPSKYNRGIKNQSFYKNFIDEIIKLEKLDKNKLLYLDYQNYEVKNIYYTNFPIDNPKIVLPTVKKIQSYFYNQNYSNKYERIYISRKKATRRFLINEIEIREILEKEYGFHTLYMEDYNLYHKINLMARAKIVASIDGTSLVNGYFSMQKKSKNDCF